MSIRHLDALFTPRSVAVVGASDRPGSVGAVVLRNLQQGCFAGPIWPVNPHHRTLGGLPVHPDVDSLPEAPQLAIVCTPAATVPDIVAALGRRGTRAAIVLSAGLKRPQREGGPSLEQAMLDAARPHLLRILGPNCIGALVPAACLNASFAPGQALPGPLAFVTQSGALATAMLDWANGRGIGFSHFVSLGDSADVDFGDLLDELGSEAGTRAILLYVESVKHARKFMSAARAAARNKPVIVVKAGRAPEGARAASSHTGALAGSDAVFDAAVRRAGMLRVDSLEALFDAAETLAHARPWRGERLALLTNGGGAGVLAADALSLGGGTLAPLSPETVAALDAVLPAGWPRANPVDIIGDAPAARYAAALRILLDAPEVDGVLFMHAPTAIVPALDIALACLPALQGAAKPVLACWLGGPAVAGAAEAFRGQGVPCYGTPERAVQAWLHRQSYQRNQRALLQLPHGDPVAMPGARATAQSLLQDALHDEREWLEEVQVRELLQVYGIPTLASRAADDEAQALAAAEEIGWPVALKIRSPQLVHKSDVGGVALDLRSPQALREAAQTMRARIARERPGAQVLGFTVQQMAERPGAQELIVGIAQDPVFGPVILFGEGGIAVELRKDRALDLPPLNAVLAGELIARTQVSALLVGHRGRPAADLAAVVDAVLKVSQMACDLAAIAELDINPLLADARGVLALDARVRLRRPESGEGSRLALRPYPAELEEGAQLAGRALLLRPVRPEDGDRLAAFYDAVPAADRRLRFFHARREVPPSELARYCLIDYEREMAFVALGEDGRIAGEVRAAADPDNERAEFAVHVAADWQRHGLGRRLMDKLLAYLRARGTRLLVGECLQDNAGMLALARGLGMDVGPEVDGIRGLRLALADAPRP